MTAGERLVQLAGAAGTASALLLAIGSGATTGAALVDYSGLPTGTAAEHLLTDVQASFEHFACIRFDETPLFPEVVSARAHATSIEERHHETDGARTHMIAKSSSEVGVTRDAEHSVSGSARADAVSGASKVFTVKSKRGWTIKRT